MPKLYQAWPGTNRFFCWGMTGPCKDWPANLYVWASIFIVLIPFSIFVAPKLCLQVTPALPIVFYLILLMMIALLLLTSFTDPGIIPRKPFLELKHPQQFEIFLIPPPGDSGRNSYSTYRFCNTCHIYRPPRASHCSTCNNCVEVFDHHCPFVNNCIGKRNYRFFTGFIISTPLAIIALVVNLVVFGISSSGSQVNSTIIIIICASVVFILSIPLVGFLGFHLYLIFTGKTTRQVLKNIKRTYKEQQAVNQWCWVDPPLIDYYQQITDKQLHQLQTALSDLACKPASFPDPSLLLIKNNQQYQHQDNFKQEQNKSQHSQHRSMNQQNTGIYPPKKLPPIKT